MIHGLNLVSLFTQSLIQVDCFDSLLTDDKSCLDFEQYTSPLIQDHYCLTESVSKLFSGWSYHVVDRQIVIAWYNVYLIPHLAKSYFP